MTGNPASIGHAAPVAATVPLAATVTSLAATTVVVPCYNEAHRLPVELFRAYAADPESARLLFVNDGSTDATENLLRSLCESSPERLQLLQLAANAGKAEAVRRGMLAACESAAFVGFWDADLATPLSAIRDFQHVFSTHPQVEMVIGARVRLLGRRVERRLSRHYLGRIFATVVSLLLRLPVYDTQCGAKLFRVTDRLRAVLAEPFVSRWIFDVELLARYLELIPGIDQGRYDELICELPLESWRDVPGSKVRARDFVRALVDLTTIARRYHLPRRLHWKLATAASRRPFTR